MPHATGYDQQHDHRVERIQARARALLHAQMTGRMIQAVVAAQYSARRWCMWCVCLLWCCVTVARCAGPTAANQPALRHTMAAGCADNSMIFLMADNSVHAHQVCALLSLQHRPISNSNMHHAVAFPVCRHTAPDDSSDETPVLPRALCDVAAPPPPVHPPCRLWPVPSPQVVLR